MRGTWTRVCLALLTGVWTGAILAATHPADDEISVVNWVAPPYWMPPAIETSSGSKHSLAIANPALAFHAVTPCRIVDTRGFGFTGPYGPPNLSAGAPRSFVVTSPGTNCNIPSGVAGVSFNFVATSLSANGNLNVYPMGAVPPTASSLNWTPSEVAIANAAVIGLGSDAITVRVNGPVGSTVDLIIDVNGYFAADPVVSSVNGISGGVNLVASGDVTVTPSAPNVTIGTNGVSVNTPSTLVRRDASGNFAAGTITGNVSGTAGGFTGPLVGDVTGTQAGTVVSTVGGSAAADIHSAELIANSATFVDSTATVVRRDGSGDFTGHAIYATSGFGQPGGEVLRVLRGMIHGSDGAVFVGGGWLVVRNSTGVYTITFTTPFGGTPVVTVTPVHNLGVFYYITSINQSSFTVHFVSPTGVAADPTYFDFIAVSHP